MRPSHSFLAIGLALLDTAAAFPDPAAAQPALMGAMARRDEHGIFAAIRARDDLNMLARRAKTCAVGNVCGTGCTPGECCDVNLGLSCPVGYSCFTASSNIGCCPQGRTCNAIPDCLDYSNPSCALPTASLGPATQCCASAVPYCNTMANTQFCETTTQTGGGGVTSTVVVLSTISVPGAVDTSAATATSGGKGSTITGTATGAAAATASKKSEATATGKTTSLGALFAAVMVAACFYL